MGLIQFDKSQLVNLQYSLKREHLRANSLGVYSSTTLIYCNTRKYHGLLVCPQPQIDNNNHVLLANLDETLIHEGQEFNLSIHKFKGGVFHPKGHKYIEDCRLEPNFKITYTIGGATLVKENVLCIDEERILVRYTLLKSTEIVTLRLRPLLAFRSVHQLMRFNRDVDTRIEQVDNGFLIKMYKDYSDLYMQLSKKAEFIHAPDWYNNIEYLEEEDRGYEFQEDLFVPGYFDVTLKKGESVIFSAGLSETKPNSLNVKFNKIISGRTPSNTFEDFLTRAAGQFIVKKGNKTEVIAGFPWFSKCGRDTFIALPGLTLALDDAKTCKLVIDTMLADLQGSLFPNMGNSYNSADAPLWFFWTLQEYAEHTKSHSKLWKEYGRPIQEILEGYKAGIAYNIKMLPNGLITQGQHGVALTWMDAVIDETPVTQRYGMAVEINALWYNAVMFALELATLAKDIAFIEEWKDLPDIIKKSFNDVFWMKEKGYLADYVNDLEKNIFVRPNMIFATSLPYTPMEEDRRSSILRVVERELLTPKGLRTLSPKNSLYCGVYAGKQDVRDNAYHQGTVWPWLLGHFAEGYLRIYGKSGISYIQRLYDNFKYEMDIHGIGTISEVFDGDPPHNPGGAISQAWSVGELLRIKKLIDKYNKQK